MKIHLLVVAGGNGSRMNSGIPKQFLLLHGIPVLMRTIRAFSRTFENLSISIVLPQDQIQLWHELCNSYRFSVVHQVVTGGPERFFSVKNGLDTIDEDSLVLIHDGVRPLVSSNTIKKCTDAAMKSGAAIPVIKITDSIRQIDPQNKSSKVVERSLFRLVQTPQVFHAALIKKAYQQEYSTLFTDDASVLEAAGHEITLVDGNIENIKITHPRDIILSEIMLDNMLEQE